MIPLSKLSKKYFNIIFKRCSKKCFFSLLLFKCKKKRHAVECGSQYFFCFCPMINQNSKGNMPNFLFTWSNKEFGVKKKGNKKPLYTHGA